MAPNKLVIEYPELPPTENKIRIIRWGRVNGKPKPLGIGYSTEAENYKKAFRDYLREHYFVQVQKFRRAHVDGMLYTLRMIFYFPQAEILNAGWPKKAKTPYKKMDVGNRRKLLEDALAEGVDIDDSMYFGLEQYKVVSDSPKVVLILEEASGEEFAVPEGYRC